MFRIAPKNFLILNGETATVYDHVYMLDNSKIITIQTFAMARDVAWKQVHVKYVTQDCLKSVIPPVYKEVPWT